MRPVKAPALAHRTAPPPRHHAASTSTCDHARATKAVATRMQHGRHHIHHMPSRMRSQSTGLYQSVQNPAQRAGTVLENITAAPCAHGLPLVSVLTFSGRSHCSRDSSRAGQDFGPESGGEGLDTLDAQAKFVRSSAADQRSPPPRTCRPARPRHTYPPPRSRHNHLLPQPVPPGSRWRPVRPPEPRPVVHRSASRAACALMASSAYRSTS